MAYVCVYPFSGEKGITLFGDDRGLTLSPLPDVLRCPEILQLTLSVLLSLFVLGRTPWSYQGYKIRLSPHFSCMSVDSYYSTWLLDLKNFKLKAFFLSCTTAYVGLKILPEYSYVVHLFLLNNYWLVLLLAKFSVQPCWLWAWPNRRAELFQIELKTVMKVSDKSLHISLKS